MTELMQQTDLNALSRILKVIAEPRRLEILALLMQGVVCNCEIGGMLNMAPNLISHHLRVLYDAGLIDMERDPNDARWIYYSIKPDSVEALVAAITNFLDTSRIQPRSPACGPQKGKCTS